MGALETTVLDSFIYEDFEGENPVLAEHLVGKEKAEKKRFFSLRDKREYLARKNKPAYVGVVRKGHFHYMANAK